MSTPTAGSLERGRACLRCRRRKIRCDGGQPACGQCVYANKIDECEYMHGGGPSATQLLEQEVLRLEGRIAELQNRSSSVLLHDPYTQAGSGSHQAQQTAPDLFVGNLPYSRDQLMGAFFHHAPQFGFFLNSSRLIQLVNASISGQSTQPAVPPVLLSVIYLLGIHFSGSAEVEPFRKRFLSIALQQLPGAVSNVTASSIVYVLQAEILISYYLFEQNRSVEGSYHASAAVAIAIAWRLHKIRSPRQSGTPAARGLAQYALPPPGDAIEEAQRVDAFWSVFVLDKLWSVPMNIPSGFADDEGTGTMIDTPWPMTLAGFSSLSAAYQSMGTVRMFMQDTAVGSANPSMLAFTAKAALLYEKAARIAAQWQPSNPTTHSNFMYLDGQLDRFKTTLPALSQVGPARPDLMRDLIVIHTLVHCATLQLHTPAAQQSAFSSDKIIVAADATANVLASVDISTIDCINPSLAILLPLAAQALMRKVASSRSRDPQRRANLLMSADRILMTMRHWSARSPLMQPQLMQLEQARAGIP